MRPRYAQPNSALKAFYSILVSAGSRLKKYLVMNYRFPQLISNHFRFVYSSFSTIFPVKLLPRI